MSGGVDLTQGQLVVVPIVQNVHQVGVEGVDVFQLRKFSQDDRQFFVEARLGELHFPHVESANTADLEVTVNDRRRLPLSL